MLWIGIAVATSCVLVLVLRAWREVALARASLAVAPAVVAGLAPAPPEVAEPAPIEPLPRAPRVDEDEGDDDEGTKVASLPLPASAAARELAVLASSPDLAVDPGLDDEPSEATGLLRVVASARTDPGRRRPHNEDAFLVLEALGVFVVADGMGGYAAGEVASQLAVDVLREAFEQDVFEGEADPETSRRADELVRAIHMANAAILAQARADAAKAGMGTTIVACRFSPSRQRVYVAHVGDSRCYRLREGELLQLTEDHTLASLGITGPSAAKLSRAVGIQDAVDVEIGVDVPRAGDRYLLCSDGLSKMVPEDRMRAILLAAPDAPEAVERLVEMANARGGRDNVTVLLIHVEEAKP